MSVKNQVNRPGIRSVIDNIFPKPDFSLDGEIQAAAQTDNYAEIGGAFNYMFTFWLAAHHSNADIARWPTQAGLNTIESDYPEYTKTAHNCVDNAEEALAAHIDTGKVTDSLCHGALDLARIEAAYHGERSRAVHLLRRLGEYDAKDVSDLQQLYSVIPTEFESYASITANPDFGPVEVSVGGIDVDVICDDTLLDIKTTKNLELRVGYWRKLVGFATLADSAKFVDDRFNEGKAGIPDIQNVGVYFSRYGLCWTVSTEDIYNHPQYGEFKDWFINSF